MSLVVIELKPNLSFQKTRNLLHWYTPKIIRSHPEYGRYRLKTEPAQHAPPVKVKGPFTNVDSRGLTFEVDNREDAEKFAAHMQKSGCVANHWIED